jgi:hypothetical protein
MHELQDAYSAVSQHPSQPNLNLDLNLDEKAVQ